MPEERIIDGAEAVRQALDEALRRWPEVYVLGEGVADPMGVFGTTRGLVEAHGPERVVEMPVAENALTGIAVGSALLGQRPVMVHQRVDFALLCLEQLFDSAAKSHYVTGGAHRVPLTVRMIIGRGWGQGPQHSQSLESVFAHIPGLKVVMPTTPAEHKGLLLAAIDDDNPVVVIEHRWLHYVRGPVAEGFFTVPLDQPRHARSGSDLTIVATSYMALESLRAADSLAGVGCQADVFDLRVLRPLCLDAIVESVRRSGRLIVCDTGWRTFGIGAEVVAEVVDRAFEALRRPPRRIGLPDHPTPSSRALAEAYYPDSRTIVEAAAELCDLDAGAVDEARTTVLESRRGVPVDQPDPAFQGPF
jgi:pyruvate dehydrogenase E1 component beta subunit